ncbi:hypothetical protein ID866_4789 [Astraeus odoratus]|nr:hypothetical protein ID866_4789 [Astraeus odoratus]
MVRFFTLPFLALLAGSAFARIQSEQEVIQDAPVHTMEGWSYVDCGLAADPIQLESISVIPDPPRPGQDLTVVVKGHVTDTIKDGAYADVTVKLGLIKLLQKQFDLCEEARTANASVQCPVEPGAYIVNHTVTLPKEIPQAKFVINVRGYTVDEEDLLCLDLKVDFMRNPFPKLW